MRWTFRDLDELDKKAGTKGKGTPGDPVRLTPEAYDMGTIKGGGQIRTTRKNADKVDLIPVMRGTKPWWKSTTIQGLAVLVLSAILSRFGLDPGESQSAALVTALMDAAGAVMVFVGRLKAEKKVTIIKPEVVE